MIRNSGEVHRLSCGFVRHHLLKVFSPPQQLECEEHLVLLLQKTLQNDLVEQGNWLSPIIGARLRDSTHHGGPVGTFHPDNTIVKSVPSTVPFKSMSDGQSPPTGHNPQLDSKSERSAPAI